MAPPVTNTAPYTAQPFDRSLTPRPAPNYGSPGYAQPNYGMRSGFGSGLLGGLLGAGIGGLLFGHGFFGGGGFGFIGFILQMVLLFFVGRWLLRMFMGPRVAMAGPGMGGFGRVVPQGITGAGASPPPGRQIAVGPADYAAFDQNLHEVQAAWSAHDIRRMQALATPEMVSYFAEQFAQQESRSVRNMVSDVTLDKGDLSEAWSEGGREYATVAMRFSMIDVTRDSAGRIVEGDPNVRTMATELWTFLRATGGRWLLSAIQQTR